MSLGVVARCTAAVAATAAAAAAATAINTVDDASVLVQKYNAEGAVPFMSFPGDDVMGSDAEPSVSEAVIDTPAGPMAFTQDGPIRGAYEQGYNVFRRIPYVEAPARFEQALPKKPWAPRTLQATEFGPGCIGSHTNVPESEDCLNMNIWLPKGGHKNMPVIVYFHGGMNQHGSGQEVIRHGDGVVQSSRYPVIFINFDFRLGLFGWIYGGEGSNVTNNLGLHDQQMALRWVSRHIAAFGGDPHRVTLEGQSEGAGIILVHMVAPGSAGLFHRAVFHSPPADMWARSANKERTAYMIQKLGCGCNELGCNHGDRDKVLECLKQKPAQEIWNADWVSEELSRGAFSPQWFSNLGGMLSFAAAKGMEQIPTYLGWHAVIDGETVPGEPRELIPQGKWNKVPVLLTVSKNESYGVFPGSGVTEAVIGFALKVLTGTGQLDWLKASYNRTLQDSGITINESYPLLHMMITDKMWTCDVRALAEDIVRGGESARVAMFWHSPRYDPVGSMTNGICEHGATCHAAEMLYVLPQGRDWGIHGPYMEPEMEFARRYSDDVLAFVSGLEGPWALYNKTSETMTFYDRYGPRAVPGYRREQCNVLDSSVSERLPLFMRRRSVGKAKPAAKAKQA